MLRPEELKLTLRENGITVHLVTPGTFGTLLVYLEEHLGQWERAEEVARELSDVRSVSFSDTNKTMMFVHT